MWKFSFPSSIFFFFHACFSCIIYVNSEMLCVICVNMCTDTALDKWSLKSKDVYEKTFKAKQSVVSSLIKGSLFNAFRKKSPYSTFWAVKSVWFSWNLNDGKFCTQNFSRNVFLTLINLYNKISWANNVTLLWILNTLTTKGPSRIFWWKSFENS